MFFKRRNQRKRQTGAVEVAAARGGYRYQGSLATIQELLGTLNDQVTASRLIKEMHPKGDPDPLTRGWIAGRTQPLVTSLNDELRRPLVSKKPWR